MHTFVYTNTNTLCRCSEILVGSFYCIFVFTLRRDCNCKRKPQKPSRIIGSAY